MENRSMDDLFVVRFALPPGFQMSGMQADVDSDEGEDREPDVKTTFAQFGLAYYQSSVLEHEIVNILAVARLISVRRDAERLLSDPWDDKFKATMGALIRQLGPHLESDPTLTEDVRKALELRNHLAHRFWRERADDFCSQEGRRGMIEFLIDTRKFFQDVDERLTSTIGASLLPQWGVTSEVIDIWYRNMVDRIERGDLNVSLEVVESARESLLARIASTTADATPSADVRPASDRHHGP